MFVGNDDDVEEVDAPELLRLGLGGTGHPGKLVVHAEVVLEGDGGHGDILAPDADPFFRLDGLMQSLRIPAPDHHAAGELVDDDHLAVADDVVLVPLERGVSLERLFEVVRQLDMPLVVDALTGLQLEQMLDAVDAGLAQSHRLVLVIDLVVFPLAQLLHDLGELVVTVGCLLGLTGDDQRGARFVDQDVVDLVDDGIRQVALDHAVERRHHVVAQVVEAELVVSAVGDIGLVGFPPRNRAQARQSLILGDPVGVVDERGVVLDAGDRQTERVVDLTHPLGVTFGEVVVDRHHVNAAAVQRVQRHREGGSQCLTFAGAHLGDLAGVQHRAA